MVIFTLERLAVGSAGSGSGLVAASRVRPAEPMGDIVDGADNESDEQALNLIAGERYEIPGRSVTGVFVRACDREEGMREHGQGDPARPGNIAANAEV